MTKLLLLVVLVLVLDSAAKIRGRGRAGERGGWRTAEMKINLDGAETKV